MGIDSASSMSPLKARWKVLREAREQEDAKFRRLVEDECQAEDGDDP